MVFLSINEINRSDGHIKEKNVLPHLFSVLFFLPGCGLVSFTVLSELLIFLSLRMVAGFGDSLYLAVMRRMVDFLQFLACCLRIGCTLLIICTIPPGILYFSQAMKLLK